MHSKLGVGRMASVEGWDWVWLIERPVKRLPNGKTALYLINMEHQRRLLLVLSESHLHLRESLAKGLVVSFTHGIQEVKPGIAQLNESGEIVPQSAKCCTSLTKWLYSGRGDMYLNVSSNGPACELICDLSAAPLLARSPGAEVAIKVADDHSIFLLAELLSAGLGKIIIKADDRRAIQEKVKRCETSGRLVPPEFLKRLSRALNNECNIQSPPMLPNLAIAADLPEKEHLIVAQLLERRLRLQFKETERNELRELLLSKRVAYAREKKARQAGSLLSSLVGQEARWLVLDVGCGRGDLLQAVGALIPGARLLGVDINESSLRVAASSEWPVQTWLGDLTSDKETYFWIMEQIQLARESDYKIALVGLHACGELGDVLLRLADLVEPDFATLVPCCYCKNLGLFERFTTNLKKWDVAHNWHARSVEVDLLRKCEDDQRQDVQQLRERVLRRRIGLSPNPEKWTIMQMESAYSGRNLMICRHNQ